MRKLYPLVTGLLIILITMKTIGQQNAGFQTFSDPGINSTSSTANYFSEEKKSDNNFLFKETISAIAEKDITCTADFEINPTPNSPLSRKFSALAWNSEQRKPVYICWKFGDGKDTCIQFSNTYAGPYPVVHYYLQPGTYEVCVRIVYEGGCEAKACKQVVITTPDECKVDFEKLAITSVTTPLYVTYNALPWNSNNKKPEKICWYFGDGKDTCIDYPENYTSTYLVRHHYREAGYYQVCVSISYYGGCEAKICKPVTVSRPDECKADFEKLTVTTVNNPLTSVFRALPWNSNNKRPKTICWTFGDGKDTCINYTETYTGNYPVYHTYREAAIYEVCVKISYYGGCGASICKRMQIGRPDECKADFERLPVTLNYPLSVYLKALPAHNNSKQPKQICWKFGDGKDTCITYPENFTGTYIVKHEYREPGNYEVCVKILYYGGCEAYNCKTIIVIRPDECKADFERLPVTSNYPLSVYFKALPAHNNNKQPKQICWKFGDGKDTCITYPENFTGNYIAKHEYHEPGEYEVCVKIIYFAGCEAYNCKKVIISRPDECKADFERLPVTGTTNPLLVYYKAIPSHNNNKQPKQICWKFGDGKDTCIEYPENFTGTYAVRHEYRDSGRYEVCVVIHYYGGCEAKKCEIIKVEKPGECHIKLYELSPSITSLVRGFYAVPASSNNKRPLLVCWYFGDGKDTCIQFNNTTISILPLIIRHTYPAPGVYRACVKIVFDGGCIAYDCLEVAIRPTTNACGGYMTDSLVSPRTIKFKGFSIHNPNDPVTGYRWTFGDGSSATSNDVTHTYNAPGTYEVCLIMNTQLGCETRICKKITVPGNTQSVLQVSPNPVENTLHVLFYSAHNEQVNIRLVNSNGVIVRSYIRSAVTGANNWDFDVATLTAGTYMLYVQSPNQLSSQLFIKH